MTKSSSKHPRLSTAIAAGTLLAFSIGAPNACMDLNQPDVAATNTGDGSWQKPIIVKRDNLAVGGALDVTASNAKATVTNPFLSDGKWTNVSGHFQIKEIREHYWPFADQFTPILPRKNMSGAGEYDFGTRAGVMVHGNTYAVGMKGTDSAKDAFSLPDWKYVKLSDDTLVVPVVTVSWKRPGADPHFVDETYQARNMFDFNPLRIVDQTKPTPYFRASDSQWVTPLPLASLNPLLASETETPSAYWQANMAPDKEEVPPDELWAQCGIQFQVVGQYIAQYPNNWVDKCSVNSLNFGDPQAIVAKELASIPLLRDYLLKDLQPVFVSYGDLSDCSSDLLGGFLASTPGKGRFIEVNFHRPRTETAHELGHALGLDHAEDASHNPIAGNLMRVNPSGETKLTAAQCATARVAAAQFSKRYDYFNFVTGRTYSEQKAPPPTGTNTDGDGDLGLGGTGSPSDVCCQGPTDVYFGAAGTCTQVALSNCDNICCSTGDDHITRYECAHDGGTPVSCPVPK